MAKVLVIDDDAISRLFVADILTDAGYEVITAKDGEEGFKNYRSGKPDVVVTDVFMEKMDGFETMNALKKNNPNVRIIAMSSDQDVSGKQWGALKMMKALGAHEAIKKPVSADTLLAAVTLPLEIYTPQREREFDEAEADLATVLSVHEPAPQPVPTVGARAGRRRATSR